MKLVGDDQATVRDLTAGSVTDKTSFSGSNDDQYYAVLGARVGSSSAGAKIFSAMSLARREVDLTNVTFSNAAGAKQYCLATIDSAGNCVGKRSECGQCGGGTLRWLRSRSMRLRAAASGCPRVAERGARRIALLCARAGATGGSSIITSRHATVPVPA